MSRRQRLPLIAATLGFPGHAPAARCGMFYQTPIRLAPIKDMLQNKFSAKEAQTYADALAARYHIVNSDEWNVTAETVKNALVEHKVIPLKVKQYLDDMKGDVTIDGHVSELERCKAPVYFP